MRSEKNSIDWDEHEPVNKPTEPADDWRWTCLSEEAHRKMLERVAEEIREEKND